MDQENANILVVDDDQELRDLTQEYLEKNGFNVQTVESGEAMDDYLLETKADLMILDLMLPGEHGLSIAQRIKKQTEIPIIIVSAQGGGKDEPTWTGSRARGGRGGALENRIHTHS